MKQVLSLAWWRFRVGLIFLGTALFVASACMVAEGIEGWEVALMHIGGIIIALPALLSKATSG